MSVYEFPFTGDAIIELGGGQRPLMRPNVDVRPGPCVDIVADLGQPMPMLTSGAFDGVFSQFAIEHISWRHVRVFMREIHRILKPGGVAVLITANLLEQARRLLDTERWTDDLVGMVFGDNDYPENSHRCGFSPSYAERLLREAGFNRVTVRPLPTCSTDMIVEAHKSSARVRQARAEG